MATLVKVPEVAETVVEGTVGRWLKREGDRVERFEPLVEVVTDKVNVEVPAPVSGVLKKILVAENTTVPVGADLAMIEEETGGGVETPVTAPGLTRAEAVEPVPGTNGAHEERPRYSPMVRLLAEEHGVDLSKITGTGTHGRVRKQDVLDYVARSGAAKSVAAPAGPAPAAAPVAQQRPAAPGAPAAAGDMAVPVTPVRATIARRMLKSHQEVPHAWTSFEVDVTGLVELREKAKELFRRQEGVNLTYLPFFIKAVVSALKENPQLNAVWADDKIVLKKETNVGVAVDRESGLIVPVVRRADEKSIAALAKELDALARKARENKLAMEDVLGGTFTITNTGSFGSVLSVPIINQPQAAILATESIVKRPAVVGDRVVVRSMMNISLSFDHRVVDGGQAGRFMQSVKRKLEAYGPEAPVY